MVSVIILNILLCVPERLHIFGLHLILNYFYCNVIKYVFIVSVVHKNIFVIICLRQLLCAGSIRPNITWFPLFPISADYSLYGDIMAHGLLQSVMRSILDKAYHIGLNFQIL